MLSEIMITAIIRKKTGTSDSRKLRKQHKQIPAIIYMKYKDSISIYIDHNKFSCLLKNKTNLEKIIKIQIQTEMFSVKIKSIQYHQYKPMILHIDFKLI